MRMRYLRYRLHNRPYCYQAQQFVLLQIDIFEIYTKHQHLLLYLVTI